MERVKSIVNGPFDPDMFAFGFENPTLDHPFMSGLYNLTNYNGTTIYPENVEKSAREWYFDNYILRTYIRTLVEIQNTKYI